MSNATPAARFQSNPCQVCGARLPKGAGRPKIFCGDACKQMDNFAASAERALDRWLDAIEDRAAAEGRAISDSERKAATGMRSRLMSAANLSNRLGSPKRIRSDRERSMWWNSTDGQKAGDRVAARKAAKAAK